jgi:pimeloyl-ACP methyl ester carboxylesterase
MKRVIDWITDLVLCPKRALYDLKNSICAVTDRHHNLYVRTDLVIPGSGHSINGSLWRHISQMHPRYCVVYLHALGSNQFEAVNLVPFLCSTMISVFAFDFQSHGIADGNMLPLLGGGADDVVVARAFLQNDFGIRKFALWGRSMGAAIGLEVVSTTTGLFECAVSDSGFASLSKVIKHVGRAQGLPRWIVSLGYKFLKRRIQERMNVVVNSQVPLSVISRATIPLLLGHGNEDNFVPLAQGTLLFGRYGSEEKEMIIFAGHHNSPRPHQWYETAALFIYRHFGLRQTVRNYDAIDESAIIHVGDSDAIMCELYHQSTDRLVFRNPLLRTIRVSIAEERPAE